MTSITCQEFIQLVKKKQDEQTEVNKVFEDVPDFLELYYQTKKEMLEEQEKEK